MQVLLLALFIAYFYVPFLLFRFFVEESVDLVRRRDLTRVDEFFSAAFPSALLNAFTYSLLRLLNLSYEVFGIGVPFPAIDWNVAAGVLDPQLAALRKHLAVGPSAEILYIAMLYIGSCFAGKWYGSIELKLMERRAAPNFFLVRGRVNRRARWLLALLFRRIWLPFFAESIHPLAPWMVHDTWLFVRTKDDRLYYGRLYEYTTNAAGDVESIVLTRTQRYARKTVAECLATGRCPLTRLSGSFVMKWSEIADINIASPSLMTAVRHQYAMKLRAYHRKNAAAKRSLLERASRLLSERRRRRRYP